MLYLKSQGEVKGFEVIFCLISIAFLDRTTTWMQYVLEYQDEAIQNSNTSAVCTVFTYCTFIYKQTALQFMSTLKGQ